MKINLISTFLFLFISISSSIAQDIYRTPTGQRYHLASCRMVENVSQKVTNVRNSGLTPCKICRPPAIGQLKASGSTTNKAVGTSKSQRCKGYTKKGTQCKHNTKLANGYCFQHTKQDGKTNTQKRSNTQSLQKAYQCGARTKSGTPCKRKVKDGGYCYQHRG